MLFISGYGTGIPTEKIKQGNRNHAFSHGSILLLPFFSDKLKVTSFKPEKGVWVKLSYLYVNHRVNKINSNIWKILFFARKIKR